MMNRISQAFIFLLLLPAGCTLFAKPQQQADTTLWPLQLAIERELSSGSAQADEPHSGPPAGQSAASGDGSMPVAILAVVDSSALNLEGDASAADQPLDTEALRRERLVQQAIGGALVGNALIEVLQPDQASLDQARAEIIAINSAALSAPTAGELGEHLGAEVLVCALIEQGGADVNIVAQRAGDGKLVYQDTIKDWGVVRGSSTEEE